jgi:ankyrin repeat protein
MEQNLQNNQGDSWYYPFAARFAGLLMILFGLIDFLKLVNAGFLYLGFFLAMAGAVVSNANMEQAGKYNLRWLPASFLLWSFFELLAILFLTIAAGITRERLLHISFLAPYWIVFGAWFLWASHRVCRQVGDKGGFSLKLSNQGAGALYKLSLLLIVFFLFLSSGPVATINISADQNFKIFPFSFEFMQTDESGYGHGKIGPLFFINDIFYKKIKTSFSMPLLSLFWYPAMFLIVPLSWLLVKKNKWKAIRVVTFFNLFALVAIPLQFWLQYGLKIIPPDGIFSVSYYIFWFFVLLQFWALYSINTQAKPAKVEFNIPRNVTFPKVAAAIALILFFVWSFLQPYLMRTPMENLIIASRNKQSHKFPTYFENFKDQNSENTTEQALREAADQHCAPLVEWLLTKQPDLNSYKAYQDKLPLYYALRGSGDLQIAEMLLKAGADPNKFTSKSHYSDTPLGLVLSVHRYSDKGLKYIELLASYGADLNVPVDRKGNYPVEYLLGQSNADTRIKRLIELGADPLKSSGGNLFYKASLSHKSRQLNRMLSAGLQPDTRDGEGNTFVHLMVERHRERNRQLIIYDYLEPYIPQVINLKNNNEETPLHLAIKKNHALLTEQLLELGADPEIPNSKGLTSIDLAKKKNYVRLLKMLED